MQGFEYIQARNTFYEGTGQWGRSNLVNKQYCFKKLSILPSFYLSSRTSLLVLTTFKKPRALYFVEIKKFWSINAFCVRCERNAGRIFLPRFLKISQHIG